MAGARVAPAGKKDHTVLEPLNSIASWDSNDHVVAAALTEITWMGSVGTAIPSGENGRPLRSLQSVHSRSRRCAPASFRRPAHHAVRHVVPAHDEELRHVEHARRASEPAASRHEREPCEPHFDPQQERVAPVVLEVRIERIRLEAPVAAVLRLSRAQCPPGREKCPR